MKYSLTNTQTLLDLNLNRIHFCLWMLSEGNDKYLCRLDYTYRTRESYPSYINKMTSPRRHLQRCGYEFRYWLDKIGKDCPFDWKEGEIDIKICLRELHKERRDLRAEFNLAKKERAELRFLEACQRQNAARFKAFHEYVRMRKLNNCIGYKTTSCTCKRYDRRYKSYFLTFSSMYGKENVNCFTEVYQSSSLN